LSNPVAHGKPDLAAGRYIHGVPEENLKAQEQYMGAMMKGEHPSQVNTESLMEAKPASTALQ
jgi:hypothetical protein